jgi:putative flippase GtrA
MTTLLRWWRFNLVGAGGVVIQLAALALLNRWVPAHYLVATLCATELAVLHNFAGHVSYTWRDRRRDLPLMTQLARFHAANGGVSVIGNLLLMRVLVAGARLPVLASNALAIVCCSLVNFWLGERWAFAEAARR